MMASDEPWYLTLFRRDWYDLLAPGGPRSPVDPLQFDERTDSEAAFVADTLALPHNAAVLDLCCGWGRHAIRLAQRALGVTGLDLSHYHLDIARNRAIEADVACEWIEADMRRVPCAASRFDAVINLFTAFGYFDDADNQRVLEEVARVLRPGGRLMIDLINRDYLMTVFRPSEWREDADGRLVLERRRWDDRSGRVHAEWVIINPDGTRVTHTHDERIYTLQELELRLNLAGLNVRDAFGDFKGSPLSHTRNRLIVLAEKRQ